MTTPTETYLLLHRVADRLEKPGAWVQGSSAKLDNGNTCGVATDPRAISHCLIGAICREHNVGTSLFLPDGPGSALATVEKRAGGSIPSWNDAPDRTQAEVVAMVRAAANSLMPETTVVTEKELTDAL